MDLDAVEAGLLGQAGPADVFGDDAGHFIGAEGARYDVVGHFLAGPKLALRGDGRRGHRELAVRLVSRV